MRMTDFQEGWAVVGNDGRRLGKVKAVGHSYILTARSGFASDLYVPVSAIANVEHDTIHLNLTQRDACRWDGSSRQGTTRPTPTRRVTFIGTSDASGGRLAPQADRRSPSARASSSSSRMSELTGLKMNSSLPAAS